MENKIIIELSDESGTIIVRTKDEQGVESVRQASHQEFMKLFEQSIEVKDFNSGLLPQNALHYKRKQSSHEISLLYEEPFAEMTYEKTTYPQFPLPRLVFRFRLSFGGQVLDEYVGVVEQGKITSESKMFHYPFGNVNNSGNICTGGNQLPRYKELRIVQSLPEHLLRLPNSDDHYRETRNQLGLYQRDLMEHLKDKDADYYYDKVLVTNGRTLREFLEGE